MAAAELFLGAVFLAWMALRLFGLFSERFMRRHRHTFSDGWLPTYSIVIALYREAAAVPDLVTALRGPRDAARALRLPDRGHSFDHL